MKIINETTLSYEDIGLLIDKVIENSEGSTHYVGQVLIARFKLGNKIIGVQIRYLKKYCEWKFVEMGK